MQDTSGRKLKTLTIAAEILEYIKNNNSVKFEDVTEQFDMPKSTAHGYLSTLENLGFIYSDNNSYKLGMRLLNLGMEAKNRNELFRIVRNKVKDISSIIDKNTDFMIEERGRVITLFNNVGGIEDPSFRGGRYFHMHCSAGGKSILAEFSADEIEHVLERWGLPKKTDKTITQREELFTEIQKIRQQGYAISDEELANGLRSLGTPVKYPDGRILGAIGVAGPAYEISDRRLYNEFPEILLKKSEELEDEISNKLKNKSKI